MPPRPNWQRQAACVGVDMFPETGRGVEQAKAVCRTCPVQDECLEHALANHESWGIWGGTSERERRRVRRRRLLLRRAS